MIRFSLLARKILYVIGAVTVASLVFFVGCGGKKPFEQPNLVFSRPTPTPHPDAARMEGRVIITYAAARDGTESAMRLVDAFNDFSDTVYVLLETLPPDVTQRYYELTFDFQAEEMTADVFDISLEWAAEFAALGYIRPVGGFAERDKMSLDEYFVNSLNALLYDGQLWGMPRDLSANLLYFRSDIITMPPRTWNDLARLATAHQGDAGTAHGLLMNGLNNGDLVGQMLEFIYMHGGRVIDGSDITVNSNEVISALTMLYEIFNAEYTPNTVLRQSAADAARRFANGESVYYIGPTSAWQIINGPGSAVRFDFSVAKLPAAGAFGSFSILDGTAMVMNRLTENADAAWEFIRFATSPAGQRILAVEGNRVPALTHMITDRDVIAANPHFTDPQFMPIMNDAVIKIVSPVYERISDIMILEMGMFLAGMRTAETAVEGMDERIREVIRNHYGEQP